MKGSFDADDKSISAIESTHSLATEDICIHEHPVSKTDDASNENNEDEMITEATCEDDIIDVESILDHAKCIDTINGATNDIAPDIDNSIDDILMENHLGPNSECNDEKCLKSMSESLGAVSSEDEIDIEVELRNTAPKKANAALSVSFPVETWRFDYYNTFHSYTPLLNRGSLNFGDMLSRNLNCGRNVNLRHSLSTTLGQQRSDSATDKPNGTVCSIHSFIKQQQKQKVHKLKC